MEPARTAEREMTAEPAEEIARLQAAAHPGRQRLEQWPDGEIDLNGPDW